MFFKISFSKIPFLGNAVFHRRPPDRAVIFCYSMLHSESFPKNCLGIFLHFRPSNFPMFGNIGFSRLFEFLVRASQDTKAGRCRHLRCAPIPHRCLIQEQHNLVRPIFPSPCKIVEVRDICHGRRRRRRRTISEIGQTPIPSRPGIK